MRTRCPDCQTIFRVTPEQLKARAGKVRCGHCQSVFNALDSLLDEETTGERSNHSMSVAISAVPPESVSAPRDADVTDSSLADTSSSAASFADDAGETRNVPGEESPPPGNDVPLDPAALQEIGRQSGLIHPRDTTEIPGYSKWSEGVVATPFSIPDDKPTRWPFALAALLLLLSLAGQVVFHFRGELAVSFPSLRPLLLSFSQILDSPLPLPARAELISIESSDLQTDTARGNLLVLNATLRNRARYGQSYPSIELSLTDVQDAAIARRVFAPREYLPARTPADQPFPANSDLAIRLWIEAKDISAAGYRLFVFYP